MMAINIVTKIRIDNHPQNLFNPDWFITRPQTTSQQGMYFYRLFSKDGTFKPNKNADSDVYLIPTPFFFSKLSEDERILLKGLLFSSITPTTSLIWRSCGKVRFTFNHLHYEMIQAAMRYQGFFYVPDSLFPVKLVHNKYGYWRLIYETGRWKLFGKYPTRLCEKSDNNGILLFAVTYAHQLVGIVRSSFADISEGEDNCFGEGEVGVESESSSIDIDEDTSPTNNPDDPDDPNPFFLSSLASTLYPPRPPLITYKNYSDLVYDWSFKDIKSLLFHYITNQDFINCEQLSDYYDKEDF